VLLTLTVNNKIPSIGDHKKSIVVLLIVAAAFYGIAQYLLGGLDTEPTGFPVNLLEGHEYSGSFEAKWDVRYEIRLNSERNLDLQEQNCLLGIETVVPERCAGTPPELVVSWRIETDNAVVASGASNDTHDGFWGPEMGKVLGSFPASRGTIYSVQVRIERSSPTLQQTNPRIKIRIRSQDLKWTYVWIGIMNQAAAFCLLLAILLSIISIARYMRTRV